ncbi:MAG: FAD:protein FMN transferase [Candidatus Dormibacteraeota bacterium]|uniref:FAD:protein FMN transferase n=1 Tax=Candidatus Amunia macphersoniae TaxID=3127014 RepID=A0A934KFI9_9BACT|nr:FAD:protein FMN transferase [Candidatus Dormibacteraeota bacterium]
MSASWRALGTSVVVAVTDGTALERAREVVSAEIDALDLACSRFRQDSDVSRLNAAGVPVVVTPLLADAIRVALRAARLTDGDVDPTVGPCVMAIGYDADFAAVPSDGPRLGRPVRAVGWRAVTIGDDPPLVTLPEGTTLDLGATAKALGSDRAAAAAHSACGCGILVSLGGDVAVAGSAPSAGWPIRVVDDHASAAETPGQRIALHSGGLATSSSTVRQWRRDRVPMHHIVDPRTGRPAISPYRTVSVAAATCVDANTASTAALVRGAGAADWLESMRLPARLVTHAGEVLHLNRWPVAAEMAA